MGSLFDHLIAWSIRNRLIVLFGAVAVVVGGLWSVSRASLDVLPDFMPARVVVQTEAAGLPTLDVEQLVTRPLEQTLLGTPDAATVRSTSAAGLSVIVLTFEDGVEIYRARQLVTERLQLAQGRLPQTVHAPQLAPIAAPVSALLKLCITTTAPSTEATARALRTFADWTVRPRLLAIPGVAQVMTIGGAIERVEVRPDPVRLRQRHVSLPALEDAVRGSQSLSGVGFVETASTRLDVQSDARLRLRDVLAVLRAVPIPSGGGPTPVRVGDVSEVAFADEPAVGDVRYDGRPAIYLQISKLPWADTITMTRQVEAAIADLARALPPGARFEPPIFRQASFIDTSIRSVGRAMLFGSLLVIVVLVAFLRYGRLAIISLTAIPLSIIAAIGVLVASGATINGMTLGGLAIAVGEVVDDAIVDVENVWRRLRERVVSPDPLPPLDVVRTASSEIRSSVVYATMIVALVLVPVLAMGGLAGRIFAPLAEAYILAIVASLVVALTVTPALCAWLLPTIATVDARPSQFATAFTARYGRLLRRLVERPGTVVVAAGIVAALAIVAVPFLGGRFLPEFHESTLIAHIQAAPGTSLAETARIAARVDGQLRPAPALHTASRIGRSELDEDMAPVNRIETDLVLPTNGREWDDAIRDVQTNLVRVPGIAVAVEGFLGERIHEILSGETAPVVIKAIGPDLTTLRTVAAHAARVAADTPGLGTVQPEPQIDVPQIRIRPDRAMLTRYGIAPAALTDAIIGWRQGESRTQILESDGRVVDVVVAGPPSMQSAGALTDLPIDTQAGASVPLGTIAQIDRVPAPAVVNHDGGERRISIGVDVRGAGLSSAVSLLEDRLAQLKVPDGYRIEVGGEAVARREAAADLGLVGLLVLGGIFMLLMLAFSSARDAAIALLNFPLGLVGGVIGALLTPDGLSVAGLVGFVTLFGIIARNGIMLIAHKQHLDALEPDTPSVQRVLRASEERLLPIVMTAATAGLGLLPLALAVGRAGSELESPMALIVCLGLVTSTALNMIVIPTIYVWLARRSDGGPAALATPAE